ncbi:YdeI/OmpD-associated family protein [Mesonia maritima]|uniref:Uncharacterized protein YdeI (YjbR/CyaY-like superfamily) n=1 Tax=Mesonia maritima TaxID=1793873 RepID=A0ABU1K433_9FLAO|nr:YdeI/OmpD-associated family protein [Mesonia maritima]MDR6300382.1 uncharacterized protein YdeI (YjbR/CyaY-like superfamily) [Mesonia maritima]
MKEITDYCPTNKNDWRNWLKENHLEKDGIWLIIHKKSAEKFNLTWSEAVEEALCFGWIDSLKKPIDSTKYRQYFSKRKPNSTWSKINKDTIEKLSKAGWLAEAGIKSIAIAKENGSWTILDSVENLEIPSDLEMEFNNHPNSKTYFLSLSKSVKKSMLQWIVLAKRTETRQKRIKEIASCTSQQKRPKNF